jgi:hypothetical protein
MGYNNERHKKMAGDSLLIYFAVYGSRSREFPLPPAVVKLSSRDKMAQL